MTTPDQKRQIRNLMAALRRRATNPAQARIFPGQSRTWISVGYETDARGHYAEPCATLNGNIVPYERMHYTSDWAAHDLAHIAVSPNPVQEYVRRYEIRNHLKRTAA